MQPWAILVHDCEELVVRVLGDADVDRRRGALSREDRGRFGQLEAANTASGVIGVVSRRRPSTYKERLPPQRETCHAFRRRQSLLQAGT